MPSPTCPSEALSLWRCSSLAIVAVWLTVCLMVLLCGTDANLTKTFGDYQVALTTSGSLSAAQMSLGQQTLSFTISDAKTKAPITNLKPYLNSFGHLVMINQTSYDYLHVHPNDPTIPPANASGGPVVTFLPIGIYGPFKAGLYRLFAQFNVNGTLFVADFTINVGD